MEKYALCLTSETNSIILKDGKLNEIDLFTSQFEDSDGIKSFFRSQGDGKKNSIVIYKLDSSGNIIPFTKRKVIYSCYNRIIEGILELILSNETSDEREILNKSRIPIDIKEYLNIKEANDKLEIARKIIENYVKLKKTNNELPTLDSLRKRNDTTRVDDRFFGSLI